MKEIGIYRLDVGSCNGCDIEVLSTLAPRFGLAKLGVKFVDEPSEASVLLVTGVPTVKMREPLKQVYEKLRDPKLVVAVGACALAGEAFEDSYSIDGMTDEVIRVNIYVPGCPPSPQAIVGALAEALGIKPKVWSAPQGFRGYPQVDAEKCTGCGACEQVCPTRAIELIDGEEKRVVKFKYEKCISCASCEEACPEDAIEMAAERPPPTRDRKAIGTSVEVGLAKCLDCSTPFVPSRQLRALSDRIVSNVGEYKALRDEIERAASICAKCRGEIENLRKAKALLLNLTEALS